MHNKKTQVIISQCSCVCVCVCVCDRDIELLWNVLHENLVMLMAFLESVNKKVTD